MHTVRQAQGLVQSLSIGTGSTVTAPTTCVTAPTGARAVLPVPVAAPAKGPPMMSLKVKDLILQRHQQDQRRLNQPPGHQQHHQQVPLVEVCERRAAVHAVHGSVCAAVRAGVLTWHQEALAESKRRREEAARQRIQALRSSDMQVGGGLVFLDCVFVCLSGV